MAASEVRITGQAVNYYSVCPRKLWYFMHELSMEHTSESVEIGKLIDESTYVRDRKHIEIDGIINIDFIQNGRELHEIKKSRKMEEVDVLQVKYYLYYLKNRGVEDFTALIDYPLLKRTLDVVLTAEDEKRFEEIIADIERIVKLPTPPPLEKKRICKSCSYGELCLI